MNKNLIEEKAVDLLECYDLMSVPVNIFKLIEKLDIELTQLDLGEDISGVLVVKNGKGRIGYSGGIETRNRFTLAHEVGHYMLHNDNENELFVDNVKVMYRKQAATRAEKKQEMEANSFGAALLMPEKLLKEKFHELNDDLFLCEDEDIIEKLSDTFRVSSIAMTYRLINLRLIENYSMY